MEQCLVNIQIIRISFLSRLDNQHFAIIDVSRGLDRGGQDPCIVYYQKCDYDYALNEMLRSRW